MMDLSYREKRIWIDLWTQLVVYGVYFYKLWQGTVTPASLVAVVVAIIVLQIILQIVLAITARPAAKDERDVAIERTSYRNAYRILVGALLCSVALLTVHNFNPELRAEFHPSPFHLINLFLVVLLVAELGKLVSQLVLYRRTA